MHISVKNIMSAGKYGYHSPSYAGMGKIQNGVLYIMYKGSCTIMTTVMESTYMYI